MAPALPLWRPSLWFPPLAPLTAGKLPRKSNGKVPRRSDGKAPRKTGATGPGDCCCGCNTRTCANCITGTVPRDFLGTVAGVSTGCTACYAANGLSFNTSGIADPNETKCFTGSFTACQYLSSTTQQTTFAIFSGGTCSGASFGATASFSWTLVKQANAWRAHCRGGTGVGGGDTAWFYLFDGTLAVTDPVRCDQVITINNGLSACGATYDGAAHEYTIVLGTGGSLVLTPCCPP